MARQPIKRRTHPLPDANGIHWQLIQTPAEILHDQWDNNPNALFEDSELTITVDWGDHEPGHLTTGLTIHEPLAQTNTVDLHVLTLGSYVGTLDLALKTKNGQQLATAQLPVQRRKLATEDDLQELQRHWTTLNLPTDATTDRRIHDESGTRPGTAQPAQWARMVRTMLQPLLTATRSIQQRPKRAILETRNPTHIHNLKRPRPHTTLAALKGKRRIQTKKPKWTPDPGAQALAARDARRIRHHIRRLREETLADAHELDPQLDRLLKRLQQRLQILEQNGNRANAHRARQAILHDDRYRLLHRASLLANRSAQTNEGELDAFRPPTYKLYEEWCTWAIVEQLADPHDYPRILQEIKRPWRERHVTLQEEPHPIRLDIQYEMSILGWKHRPDLILHLNTPTTISILDVKYRGTGEDLTDVPSDAIAELHRYRDAYMLEHEHAEHKEVWAAILHPAPGWSDGTWEPTDNYEGALNPTYRIGSVPVSPSLIKPLENYLDRFLPADCNYLAS